MFQFESLRIARVLSVAALLGVVGGTFAGDPLTTDAPSVFEVKVTQVQTPAEPTPGTRYEIVYHMEIISVLRSRSGVKPGDTIEVRAYAVTGDATGDGSDTAKAPMLLTDGWMGTAYLRPDSSAGDPAARGRFTVAAGADSFEGLPPGEPSLIYEKWPDGTIK
jgi:hypothetical protein